MKRNNFKNNVVIITGASSGIGEELAIQLAKQGAFLSLAARDEQKLNSVKEKCLNYECKVISIPTDVTLTEDCKNLIDKTFAEYRSIDTLINNAGITMWANFSSITDLSYTHKIIDTNFFGSMNCTYFALPHLIKSKGRLVGVSSLTGKFGVPTRSIYSASKHAMAGFFDSLRIELKDKGVSVTMVYPGFVSSEIRGKALGSDGKPIGQSPVKESDVMSVETCAKIIIDAAANRKREVVMTAKGKLGMWLKLIAPALVDLLAMKAIKNGK